MRNNEDRPRSRLPLVVALLLVLVAAGGLVAFALVRDGEREASRPPAPGPGISPGTSLETVFTQPPRRPGGRPGAPGAGVGAPGGGRIEHVPGRLAVKFAEGADPALVRRLLGRADADVDTSVAPLDLRIVEVAPGDTREAIEALTASPAVEYVERDVVVHGFETVPNDTLWGEQWGPALVEGPSAWDLSRGTPKVVVAVLDTGVDPAHADLQGALIPGYDFVNGDPDPTDDEGHGTAVAGVIAARTNNATGLAGICWTCSLMPVKVLDASGSGSMADVAAGIVWAVDRGARVINMSLGGPQSTQALADAVAYATARGAILVAAAGNEGASAASYPAALDGVVSISATTVSDALYSWSNYGSWVDVAAPGCNVAPYVGGSYVNFCGTSSATPAVSGIVGLALAAKPGATAQQVQNALVSSAVPLGGAVQHGRVRASEMLRILGVRAPAAAPVPTRTAPERTAATPKRQTARGRVQLGRRTLPSGRLTATLLAPGTGPLALEVVDARGRVVGRASGRSPLRLTTSIVGGKYTFLAHDPGGRRESFRLRLVTR